MAFWRTLLLQTRYSFHSVHSSCVCLFLGVSRVSILRERLRFLINKPSAVLKVSINIDDRVDDGFIANFFVYFLRFPFMGKFLYHFLLHNYNFIQINSFYYFAIIFT